MPAWSTAGKRGTLMTLLRMSEAAPQVGSCEAHSAPLSGRKENREMGGQGLWGFLICCLEAGNKQTCFPSSLGVMQVEVCWENRRRNGALGEGAHKSMVRMQSISLLVWLRHNLSEQEAETGADPDIPLFQEGTFYRPWPCALPNTHSTGLDEQEGLLVLFAFKKGGGIPAPPYPLA